MVLATNLGANFSLANNIEKLGAIETVSGAMSCPVMLENA